MNVGPLHYLVVAGSIAVIIAVLLWLKKPTKSS